MSKSESSRLPESRRVRVLRLLPVLDFGGVESRVALQAAHMDRSRFELRVCTFHDAGRAARVIQTAGVAVDVLNVSPSPRRVRPTIALARHLARVRPDIVHASIAEANLHGVLAARIARVPVIIAEEVGTPSHGALARVAFRIVYRAAHAAIGVTRATCEYLVRVDGAPRDRVHCIYNCAAADHFPEARPTPHDGPKMAAPLRVLLVGRLVPVKNHAAFLEAIASVADELDARVRIVGDGPLRDDLWKLVVQLGLKERVELLGFRPDVRELLREADLFALPSLSEGCSVSLVEAMAAGVPVLASRVPGVREVLGERLASVSTVEPRDAPGWVSALRSFRARSPMERRELATSAQLIAYERFSPGVYLRNLEELYTKLWAEELRPRAGRSTRRS